MKRISLFSMLISSLLAGCGSQPATAPIQPPEGYLVTLNVTDGSDQATLERRYNGKALVFDAKSGFAMLYSGSAPDKNDPAVRSFQANGTSSAPDLKREGEVQLDGSTSWGGGSSSWSNGIGAWSSGSAAWGSGSTSWGSGSTAWGSGSTSWGSGSVVPALPVENQTTWEQIKLYEAHRLSRKLGDGITVAVIDSGIDLNHSVFAGKLSPQYTHWDFVGNDPFPQDEPGGEKYGHGTAVAGIILQVAPRAKIMPIRVLRPDGSAETANVVRAIVRAVNNQANLINLSLGTDGRDQSLLDICDWANRQGVRIVASAGNNGTLNLVDSPARFSNEPTINQRTIGIGSVNAQDVRSAFSSYGDGLFAFAPGENINSAYPGNQSGNFTGTSFATPIYTGALALALSETTLGLRPTINLALNAGNDQIDSGYSAANGSRTTPRLNLEKMIRSLPGWSVPLDVQAGVYRLVNVLSQKCLNVAGGSKENWASIDQATCAATDAQKWQIELQGPGLYKLKAVHSGRVIAITNSLPNDGTPAVQWDDFEIADQKFRLNVVNSGGPWAPGTVYQLVASHSNKCLALSRPSSLDGAVMVQKTCEAGVLDKFVLKALF
jgi:Subtilase family/Ricin-type beta-trefoil lectin domain-like